MAKKDEKEKMEVFELPQEQTGNAIVDTGVKLSEGIRTIPATQINFTSESSNIPFRGSVGAAGSDLIVTGYELIVRDRRLEKIKYLIDTAVEIPMGCFGMLAPRSNVSKKPIMLCNSIGVIDHDYRGNLCAYFEFFGDQIPDNVEDVNRYIDRFGVYDPVANLKDDRVYHIGERAVQLVIVPFVLPVWNMVESLSETERGEGGFGSTGL